VRVRSARWPLNKFGLSWQLQWQHWRIIKSPPRIPMPAMPAMTAISLASCQLIDLSEMAKRFRVLCVCSFKPNDNARAHSSTEKKNI